MAISTRKNPSRLKFAWFGPPRFNQGGQDVIGPETIYHNLEKFTPADSRNPLTFFCQAKYIKEYEDYFKKKNMQITVSSVEDYFKQCKADLAAAKKGDAKTDAKEDKSVDTPKARVIEVEAIYNESVLNEKRGKIIDLVYMKDLFFSFLLATEGDYVLDTNVQASSEKAVAFPAYDKFHMPWVTNIPEVWMLYAPPGDLKRAQKCFADYLQRYSNAAEIFSKHGYSEEYHKKAGQTAVFAVALADSKQSKRKYVTEDCGIWDCGQLAGISITVPEIFVAKEYYNSHLKNREHSYGAPHTHVLCGIPERLQQDLSYGISPDLVANPRRQVETTLDYDADNETLLHIAIRYAGSKDHLKCAELLLKAGADPNKKHVLTRHRGSAPAVIKEKTPLTYALDIAYSQKQKTSTTTTDLLVMQTPPEFKDEAEVVKNALQQKQLPIKSESAYVRINNKLFYVNKTTEECNEVKLDTQNNVNILKEFDKILNPTTQARALTSEEAAKITSLTGHTRIDPLRVLFDYATKPIDVNAVMNNESALLSAINCDVNVAILLTKGADPNLTWPPDQKDTPLASAIRSNKTADVKLLLEMGHANPNLAIKQKQTSDNQNIIEPPLHLALKNHNEEMVQLLLSHGADPNSVSETLVKGQIIKTNAADIATSDKCKTLLKEAMESKLQGEQKVSSTAQVMSKISITTLNEEVATQSAMSEELIDCQIFSTQNDILSIILHYKSNESVNEIYDNVGSVQIHGEKDPNEESIFQISLSNSYGTPARVSQEISELNIDMTVGHEDSKAVEDKYTHTTDLVPMKSREHLEKSLKQLQDQGFLSKNQLDKIHSLAFKEDLSAIQSPSVTKTKPSI